MSLNFKEILLFTSLFIVNVILKDTTISIILTIGQCLYVISLFLKGKIQDAVFWHFIFMLTSFAISGGIDEDVVKTGYFSTKLVGNITLSYVIAIILYVNSARRRPSEIKEHISHFKYLRNVLTYFLCSGVLLGILGVVFSDYYIGTLIGYSVYIFVVWIHACLLINVNTNSFLKKCYEASISLLIASILSTLFNYSYGVTTEYSVYETTVSSSLSQFSIILIFFVKELKMSQKILVSTLLTLSLLISILSGSSGKFFLYLGCIGVIYLLRQRNGGKKSGIVKAGVLLGGVVVISFAFMQEESLFAAKLGQFISMGALFHGQIEDIEASPYIRVASMLNIYLENIKNPIYFCLGRGFGGYFQDILNLFPNVVLTQDAFADIYVASGKYPTAHSTFNLVPLFHGFPGLFMIFRVILMYIKDGIKGSNLAVASVIWLLFMFYFDIQLAVIGLFLLYSSHYFAIIQNATD